MADKAAAFAKRTHTCGELRAEHAGTAVVLNGWVDKRRDHGSLCFVDLRDRYGITQVKFDTARSAELLKVGHRLRPEFVVSIEGKVCRRPEGTANKERPTGEVEVEAERVVILNESKTPPFEITDAVSANEDLRLRYRYLDLRRPSMQANLILRHKLTLSLRHYFDEQGFLEVETPCLTRSTPEGARDYLVPSRVNPGSFYALPQSPQLFKQLLMVSGFDRYFQIVRCFRDEDLRADRQPEFTQLDIEMSFPDEEMVYALVEGAMARAFADTIGVKIPTPFPRL